MIVSKLQRSVQEICNQALTKLQPETRRLESQCNAMREWKVGLPNVGLRGGKQRKVENQFFLETSDNQTYSKDESEHKDVCIPRFVTEMRGEEEKRKELVRREN